MISCIWGPKGALLAISNLSIHKPTCKAVGTKGKMSADHCSLWWISTEKMWFTSCCLIQLFLTVWPVPFSPESWLTKENIYPETWQLLALPVLHSNWPSSTLRAVSGLQLPVVVPLSSTPTPLLSTIWTLWMSLQTTKSTLVHPTKVKLLNTPTTISMCLLHYIALNDFHLVWSHEASLIQRKRSSSSAVVLDHLFWYMNHHLSPTGFSKWMCIHHSWLPGPCYLHHPTH